jgi:hypothetical protein
MNGNHENDSEHNHDFDWAPSRHHELTVWADGGCALLPVGDDREQAAKREAKGKIFMPNNSTSALGEVRRFRAVEG